MIFKGVALYASIIALCVTICAADLIVLYVGCLGLDALLLLLLIIPAVIIKTSTLDDIDTFTLFNYIDKKFED